MITLIRHGATAENLAGQYIGVTDALLCPEAERTLAENAHRYPKAPTLFVSPMRRCRQTASILYPGQEQIVLLSLRECDFGAFEGKTYAQLRNDPDYATWIASHGMVPPPGGEGREVFCKRCIDTFCNAADACCGEDAVFVVHGGVIMALLEAFLGGDFYDWQFPPGGGVSTGLLCGRFREVTNLLREL